MNPTKKAELISAMDQAQANFTRLPGPSDDPDEITAFASAYRHLLIKIQMLAGPVLSTPIRRQLDEISIDPNSIYDVYDAIPRLDTLMIDIREALELQDPKETVRLATAEISRLVNNWIGVDSGYLGYPVDLQFTYASHDAFWLDTCGIVADTHGFEGTTRECFIETLRRANADQQARTLEAVLDRFPVNAPADADRPMLRTSAFEVVIRSWITRLRGGRNQRAPTLALASEEVREALGDAEKLGARRAVDRVHTAMHGYLHHIYAAAGLTGAADKPTMARLLKSITNDHPAFAEQGPNSHVIRVLTAMGTILDALNPIRNDSSAAHPMNDTLDEPEAELVCDSVHALLRYLDSHLSSSAPKGDPPLPEETVG